MDKWISLFDPDGIERSPRAPSYAKPFVVWNHIDGPYFCTRFGEIFWLTWWEKLLYKLRLVDAYQLEAKVIRKINGSWFKVNTTRRY